MTTLAKAGMQDVSVDIHCPTLTDIKDKESSCPTGFTYGYPRQGERLDPQRLRRIDRIHTTPDLLSLATSVYPMFAANSDHKAILAEFTPPSFETEDTAPKFYCPETILQDSEAMEDLETSLKSINSTGDQWWEEALGCIQKKAVSYQREHKTKSSRLSYKPYGSCVVPQETLSHQRSTNFFRHWGLQRQMRQQPTPSWWGCMKRHSVTERAWKHSPSSRG